MNTNQAKQLARYHKFTKKELNDILCEAYNSENSEYWQKPNGVNKIFSNGYYFNRCVDWLKYKEDENDNIVPEEIIVVRILQIFGKYSKVQVPKKMPYVPPFTKHEEPKM